MKRLDTDLAIVGAGMAGLTLAVAFARAGARVALIEKVRLADLSAAEFDGRGSAIAAGSQRILAGLGLWERFADDAGPINEIRVADGASPLFLHYDHTELGEGPLGWIVENAVMRRAMADAVGDSDVEVRDGVSVTDATYGPDLAILGLDDGREIRARLVVAADGRDSPMRESAGIGAVRWRYAQTGIVCTVAHELPHHGIAHEHFLPAGPFAILPMTGNRSSIVWTERNELVPEIMALDDDGFADELRARFGRFLGEVTPGPRRWAYPLSVVHAHAYVAPRLALVGDAAHAVHPIAGQGFNLGLRDVAALAEVTVDTLRLGLDPGAEAPLARYEKWRRPDNMMMLAVTDVLNRLFSNDIAPVAQARDLGLAAVNRAPALKKVLMRHAMGLVGDLPRLTRGEPL
jgi:2-octaprenyl-6-methoxyphenol hydroxylase